MRKAIRLRSPQRGGERKEEGKFKTFREGLIRSSSGGGRDSSRFGEKKRRRVHPLAQALSKEPVPISFPKKGGKGRNLRTEGKKEE